MKITRKILSLVPVERSSPRIIDERQLYARGLMHTPLDKLVYLDETGLICTVQNFGYSPVNEKAFITVPASRGQNISLMAAISVSGVVSYEIKDGAYNGDLFKKFILIYLLPCFTQNQNCVLIMDNF
jgi:hypothetical protein